MYLTSLLAPTHEKSKFTCGKAPLDEYIQKRAKQDIKAKVAACFVFSDDDKKIIGYYTLSNDSIPRHILPEHVINKLPKYKDLPVTLLGRLAIHKDAQGQQLGQLLLMDALKRSYDSSFSIGSMAVVVDPIDESARMFYSKYGFIQLPDNNRMFLPIKTIEQVYLNSVL